jgi:hypothetical protein
MVTGHPKLGVKPHPIRKRAFNRALRRGDLILILPYQQFKKITELPGGGCTLGEHKFSEFFFDRNCPNDEAYITWPLKVEFGFTTGDIPE